MQGVIVCDPEAMIALLVGAVAGTTDGRSTVVGTAMYCREWIDRYIARLFLDTTGPIHVFNAYRGALTGAPCPWGSQVIDRLNAFASAGIIPPPVIYDGSAWITPVPGLKQKLPDFEWCKTVAVRDRETDVLLKEGSHNAHHIVECTQSVAGDAHVDDGVYVSGLNRTSDRLRLALSAFSEAFIERAKTLSVPEPEIDASLLERWAESNTEPATCGCLLTLLFNDHPAFSPDMLEPLGEVKQESRLATIVRKDSSYDDGIGVDTVGNDGYYVVSFGLRALGDLLIAGVEQHLASASSTLLSASAVNMRVDLG